MRVNIIDADSIVYAAGFVCQTPLYYMELPPAFGSGVTGLFKNLEEVRHALSMYYSTSIHPTMGLKDLKPFCVVLEKRWETSEPLENCLHTAKQMLKAIDSRVGADETVIFLSGSTNFRYSVDPEYKANRASSEKPIYFDEIRKYLKSFHNAVIVEGMEADDAVGIKHAECLKAGICPVVTSIDKDLDQLQGLHYNWKKETLYTVTWEKATKFFYMQLLTGDSTDNIQGLPGIGPKKAEKILEDVVWILPDAEKQAMRKVGLAYACHPKLDDPEEHLLKTYQLVKILTEPL